MNSIVQLKFLSGRSVSPLAASLLVLLADCFGSIGLAAAPDTTRPVVLGGDVVGAEEIDGPGGGTGRLAVFWVDSAKPRRGRHLTWFEKRDGGLVEAGGDAVSDQVGAYDVCAVGGTGAPRELLLLDRTGVRAVGRQAPLAKVETVMAHTREDVLPRVKMCLDLWEGEPPALAVPTLSGIELFRQRRGGGFVRIAAPRTQAEVGFQGQILRGDARDELQRLTVRFEFPDLKAVDFNADGRRDLCFIRSRRLACHLQTADGGFADQPDVRFIFDVLSESEARDPAFRIESRLVDVSGDGRPDFVVAKTDWKFSDMSTAVHVFLQDGRGGFAPEPAQTLTRRGFFGYHEFFDTDGDRLPELVAPVTALGWTDFVSIYLTKKAAVELIAYRNTGGRFDPQPRVLHKVEFPVDFRNISGLLGALPVWNLRMVKAKPETRQIAFFPEKSAIELRAARPDGSAGDVLWSQALAAGSDVVRTDLDHDGFHELVILYQRDQERSRQALFVDSPRQ